MIAIVQARLSSKRFKGKVLTKIKGKTILDYIIQNLKKSNYIKKIVVVTSIEKSDNKLVKFLKKNKINFFRGSLNNVALRICNAVKKEKKSFFIRICADSPLIDYRIIDKCVKIKKKNLKSDIITNVFPRTFPKGQSVEIIKTKLLFNNIKHMNAEEKEHVTKFFYKNHKKFKIINFKKTKEFIYKHDNLSVDYKKDLKLIRKLI